MHTFPLAEIDANGWTIIITAVFLGLTKLWSMYLDYRRELAKVDRDKVVAAKVEQVAATQASTAREAEIAAEVATAKLDGVAAKVEEVHKATNSLTDRLVEKTEREAHARGGAEARAEVQAPFAVAVVPALVEAIAAVPEKTAAIVVEKLKDVKGA